MYTLAKTFRIKPWEANMSYDDNGRPIVYKDDIDALIFLDALNKDGIAHVEWLDSHKGK